MECKKRREEGLKLRKESKTHLRVQGGLHISSVVDLLVMQFFEYEEEECTKTKPSLPSTPR